MEPSSSECMVDVLAGLMLAVVAVSLCYPWKPEQALASRLIHLPLSFIPLWIAYEAVMPARMNIRVDLLVIPPLLLFVLLIWAIKVARFRKLSQEPSDH